MTILDRIAGDAGSIDLGRIASDIRGDLPAIRTEALDTVERALDAASRAAERAAEGVGRMADESIGASITRASRELDLEGRVDEVVRRIRREVPRERLTSIVAGLERELPSTDRDRYDRAYARGWTRARTSFVGAGLLAGLLAGIVGAFFLDPGRGKERRDLVGSKARSIGTTAASRAKETASTASGRVRGLVGGRGTAHDDAAVELPAIAEPAVSEPAAVEPATAESPSDVPGTVITPLVGVMDPDASPEPVPDQTAIDRQRMTAEGGRPDPVAIAND